MNIVFLAGGLITYGLTHLLLPAPAAVLCTFCGVIFAELQTCTPETGGKMRPASLIAGVLPAVALAALESLL